MARVSIEDCLESIENRFALVAVAADRARQIMGGDEPLLRTKNKEAVTALREIAEGMVVQKDYHGTGTQSIGGRTGDDEDASVPEM